MLARTPWTPKEAIKVKPKRLSKDHFSRLVDTACDILRNGEPTKFALEGYCRASLRSGLCLKGWPWATADLVASDIVAIALNRLGANRPTWQEGQPEWTQHGIITIPRTRCINCGGNLPEGHIKFCSRNCGSAHNMAIMRADDRKAANAKVYAYYAKWSAKQPDQPCEGCGTAFKPPRPGAVFCSVPCRNRSMAKRKAKA